MIEPKNLVRKLTHFWTELNALKQEPGAKAVKDCHCFVHQIFFNFVVIHQFIQQIKYTYFKMTLLFA